MSEKRFKMKKLEYESYFIDSQQEYVDEDEPGFEINGEKIMSDSQILDLLNENEQLKQAIDDMGGRLQGLWANYYENRYGIWSQAIEDVAKELGFKIWTIYDDPISMSDQKEERINGVKMSSEIAQLKQRINELKRRL